MTSLYGNAEESFSKAAGGQIIDRTFLEKIFGKEEMTQIKNLMEKKTLTEQDISELEYLTTTWESKLVNHGEKSRYLCGKFTTWIADFNSINILLTAMLEKEGGNNIEEGLDALFQAKKIADLCTKRLVNTYLYFSRTTLSLRGFAFGRVTQQTQEVEYRAQWPGFTPDKTGNTTYNIRGAKP